ncbi:MAG: enoyl-CoA hydratase/isomerase family protein [Pseudomonadota bacterium]
MNYDYLQFEQEGHLAVITLNRPEHMNALHMEMSEELLDAAFRCDTDKRIRGAVITGAGKMFCAGGDLKTFLAAGDEISGFVTKMATILHAAIARFNRMDPPVVMAINGTAAGGGFSFALSGDYSIASEQAKFVSAYTSSGLSPDASSTYFIAKHVGLLRAKELVLTNRVLNAEEALAWGLVSRVVPHDNLMEEALKLGTTLSNGPTKAYGMAKKLLHTAYSESMESQLEFESQGIASMMRTKDAQGALKSFVEKSKPAFSGE